jgi:hypothetical protein
MPTAVEHGSVGREPGGNATLQSESRVRKRFGLANSKLATNIPARWVSEPTGSKHSLLLTFTCDNALARLVTEGSVPWDPRYGLFIA